MISIGKHVRYRTHVLICLIFHTIVAFYNLITWSIIQKGPYRSLFTSIKSTRPAPIDGKTPANQLRLVVYPIISKVLYIPGGCLGFLNHQQYQQQGKQATKNHFVEVLQTLGVQDQPKNGLVFRMIHGFRIPDPMGKSWSTWTAAMARAQVARPKCEGSRVLLRHHPAEKHN